MHYHFTRNRIAHPVLFSVVALISVAALMGYPENTAHAAIISLPNGNVTISTPANTCSGAHPVVVFNWTNLALSAFAFAGGAQGYWIRATTNPATLPINVPAILTGQDNTGTFTWNGAAENTHYYFYITIGGQAQAVSQGDFVTGMCPSPNATISQSSVTTGVGASQPFTINWGSTNSTSCSITNNGNAYWTGTSGSHSTYAGTNGTYTFTFVNTCTNATGRTDTATVVHNVVALPNATISQSLAATTVGQAFTVTWNSSGATSCSVTHTSPGGSPVAWSSGTSGSPSTSQTTAGTHGWTVTCSNAVGQTDTASISHTVTSNVAASISQNTSASLTGQAFNLTWGSSGGATACSVTYRQPNGTTGTFSNALSGTNVSSGALSQVGTYTYTNTCTDAGGYTDNDVINHSVSAAPTTGNIVGRVFFDTNGNGAADAGELYIEKTGIACASSYAVTGAYITKISGPTAFTVSSTVCNAQGALYDSGAVAPGTYVVSIVPPAGWVRTNANTTTTVAVGGYGTPQPWFGIAPLPTASISASPSTISLGAASTLTWSSTNATSCTGSGFSTGGAASGSVSVSPSSTTNFGVTCTSAVGQDADSATVTVLIPTSSLVAAPTRILVGDDSSLTYSAQNVASCTLKDDTGTSVSGFPKTAVSGSVSGVAGTGPLSHSKTYTFACTGPGGATSSDTAGVLVVPGFGNF